MSLGYIISANEKISRSAVIGDSLLEIPVVFHPASSNLRIAAKPIPSEFPTINACSCTDNPLKFFVLYRCGKRNDHRPAEAGRRGLYGYMSIIPRPKNLTMGSKSLSQCNNVSWLWIQNVPMITFMVFLTATPFLLKYL